MEGSRDGIEGGRTSTYVVGSGHCWHCFEQVDRWHGGLPLGIVDGAGVRHSHVAGAVEKIHALWRVCLDHRCKGCRYGRSCQTRSQQAGQEGGKSEMVYISAGEKVWHRGLCGAVHL
jgi:hypothetical protein